MKALDLIVLLQDAVGKHGNRDVWLDGDGGYSDAGEVEYRESDGTIIIHYDYE